MNPTLHLRFNLKGKHRPTKEEIEQFVKAYGSSHSFALRELTKPGTPTLQQWWSGGENFYIAGNPDGCIGEWRDVPLEVE